MTSTRDEDDKTPDKNPPSECESQRRGSQPKKQRLIANFDQERQEEIRRANRVAAQQFRKRKKKVTQDLSNTLRTLMEENQMLLNQHNALLTRVAQVKSSQSAMMNVATLNMMNFNMLNNIQMLRATNQQQQQVENVARQLLLQPLAAQTQSQDQQRMNSVHLPGVEMSPLSSTLLGVMAATGQHQQIENATRQQLLQLPATQNQAQNQAQVQARSQGQEQVNTMQSPRAEISLQRSSLEPALPTNQVLQHSANPSHEPPMPPLGFAASNTSLQGERAGVASNTPLNEPPRQQIVSPLNRYLALTNLNWLSQMGLRTVLPSGGANHPTRQESASNQSSSSTDTNNDNNTKPHEN